MKKIVIAACFIAGSMIAVSACKKKDKDDKGTTPVTSVLSATVDGNAFAATDVSALLSETGSYQVLNISGYASDDHGIFIGITNYNGAPGSYPVSGSGGDASAAYMKGGDDMPDPAVYGAVEITSVSGGAVKGTFYFTTMDSVRVTGGSFTVAEPAQF